MFFLTKEEIKKQLLSVLTQLELAKKDEHTHYRLKLKAEKLKKELFRLTVEERNRRIR